MVGYIVHFYDEIYGFQHDENTKVFTDFDEAHNYESELNGQYGWYETDKGKTGYYTDTIEIKLKKG